MTPAWSTPQIVELPAKEAREALERAHMVPGGKLASPDPLVTTNVDVRDLDGFLLNVEKLMASELFALSNGDEFKAAVALWCRAWKQIPAASLPKNEEILQKFSGIFKKSLWKKVRNMALRGFILCSDNRYYHPVLAEAATKAYESKIAFINKRLEDADRLRRWREKQKGNTFGNANETEHETLYEIRSETRFVAEVMEGKVRESKIREEDSSLRSESIIPNQDSQTETIDRKSKKPKPKTRESPEFDARFWPAYPHKVGKPAAARAFTAAIKKASIEQILAGLDRYLRDKPPDRPWCNPATWLNQDRWLDQPAAAQSIANGHRGPITAFSRPTVGDEIAAFEQSAARHEAAAKRLRAEIEADKQKTLELGNGKLGEHSR